MKLDWFLKLIPTEAILRWVARQLTNLDDHYIDLAVSYVEYYDKQNLPGYEKRKKVYETLRQSLDNVADWVINFLIEWSVAYIRMKQAKAQN